MMSNPEKIMLDNLKEHNDIQGEKDTLGGGGPLNTGIYPFKVDLAYVMKSEGGATGIVLHLSNPSGQSHRETLWAASGNAKGNKNYYETSDGTKNYLPGFIAADALSRLTTGKSISETTIEEKIAKVYDPEAKQEVPTKVQALVDIIGQEVYAGLIKETVDKTAKTDNGYEPTGETREQTVIDKFFRAADKLTVPEIKAGDEEAVFFAKWEEKYPSDFVRNKVKGASSSGNAPKSGAPANAQKAAAPAPKGGSLFS
tara:strand:- start:49490 stop:50257 length:768 start_codon:yes stop_codon:yes gene_type:complete